MLFCCSVCKQSVARIFFIFRAEGLKLAFEFPNEARGVEKFRLLDAGELYGNSVGPNLADQSVSETDEAGGQMWTPVWKSRARTTQLLESRREFVTTLFHFLKGQSDIKIWQIICFWKNGSWNKSDSMQRFLIAFFAATFVFMWDVQQSSCKNS